jgi:hypothetical protein
LGHFTRADKRLLGCLQPYLAGGAPALDLHYLQLVLDIDSDAVERWRQHGVIQSSRSTQRLLEVSLQAHGHFGWDRLALHRQLRHLGHALLGQRQQQIELGLGPGGHSQAHIFAPQLDRIQWVGGQAVLRGDGRRAAAPNEQGRCQG